MYHEYIGDNSTYLINNSISLNQNNQTTEKEYVTFVLNVHDWVFPEKSADSQKPLQFKGVSSLAKSSITFAFKGSVLLFK